MHSSFENTTYEDHYNHIVKIFFKIAIGRNILKMSIFCNIYLVDKINN